jgi:5-methylcytosine-specific restriction endonuclease McrA
VSASWAGGSTRGWRTLRLYVLTRDQWVCQLCEQPIDPLLIHPHPRSPQVHHIHGKALGDDPRFLQAAHRDCNLKARVEPQPRRVSRW